MMRTTMGGREDDATQKIEILGSPTERPSAPDNNHDPEVFGLSDVGQVRRQNEDSFLVARLERSMRLMQSSRPFEDDTKVKGPPQGWLMMVADGMGGHAAGEVASALTIDALARYAFTLMPWSLPRSKDDSRVLAKGLRQAVREVQNEMRRAADEGTGSRGMGTTLTMAYVTWPNLFVVHVGDSRIYALRDGQLYQITRDHTLAQQLVDSKVMSEDEAESSDFSNVLVNALGGESEELNIELHHALLFPNDTLILCSDGLTKHVTKEEICAGLEGLSRGETAESCTRGLVSLANQRGGTDNVTVVVAHF